MDKSNGGIKNGKYIFVLSGLFLGIALGLILGLITCRIIIGNFNFDRIGDQMLNDPAYTIDTTTIIHKNDTTYNYKFVKI